MTKYCIILITSNSQEEAEKIARGLVKEKLAACVQISPPIQSIYHWKDEICEDREIRLVIKTKTVLFPRIEKYVKENHSYEVPQIISVPVESGSADYLSWLEKSCDDI